jgi:tetratricopeptide (TPR) repeat protein
MNPAPAEQLAADAMRAHRAGLLSEAEALTRRALEVSPDHFNSLVHLSVLLRHKGDFGDSMVLAARAIEIRPHSVDGYTQVGLCLLGTGRSDEAIDVFSKAISLSPNLAPLHHNLGLALENRGRTQEAKRAFLDASRLAPNDVRARLSLGSLLLTEEDVSGARAQAETAIRLDPRSGAAHLLQAKVLVAEGKGILAEASIRRSLELDPDSSFGHTMLGFRLLQTGQFEIAEREFERSIDLDGAQGVAYFGITQARKILEADRHLIDRMQSVLAGSALTYEQASYLHFGLAKAFDNLGEIELAMEHYDAAHENARLFRYGDAGFDEAQYEADIDSVIRLYTGERVVGKAQGIESDLPIFIVGMMRSGTTLTEQILSSHPLVGAAGENEFWAKRGQEAEDAKRVKVDGAHAASLARQYCRELRKVCPGTRHVTDKLPGNYLRLGLIHMALPKAKIIHCRRSPVDTALSIYFTANPTAQAFSHTKEGIVFAYRQHLHLMEHWRSVLPPEQFYELQYEELVAEPERVIRSVLQFLELEWDDACLNHDKNAKEVRTPSLWQVRQPIYSSSVQRWRRYEPWLGAFRELVELP